MPDLLKSLQNHDLGYIKILGELWRVELEGLELKPAMQRLAQAILNRPAVQEMVASLPAEARDALDDLMQQEGRLSWHVFTRRHGMVREMGAGRRDRLQPHLNPVSPAEVLWYRGLVARAFLDTPAGLEEFAYIPDDFLPFIPAPPPREAAPLGRLASPGERAHPLPASDRILDHACSLLAGLRSGYSLDWIESRARNWCFAAAARFAPLSVATLHQLLLAAGLVDAEGLPMPEPVREFLACSRAEALAKLYRLWVVSPAFNELRLLPGLDMEGEWQNDPLRTRQTILDFLATVPGREPGAERPFWSLAAFVDAVRHQYPDFQRPAGDYDSWYIRQLASGEFLRGVEHWDEVDGALIRYMICGPLHWLGVLDLAASAPWDDPQSQVTAFRYSAWAANLLQAQPPENLPLEDSPIQVRSDFIVVVPRLAPRSVRYQLARFGDWEKEEVEAYHYRLTPASLKRARQQGLTSNHLLALLRRHARTIAPNLVKAIERWERNGVEARFEQLLVLRLATPELLQLVRNSRAARFLGDPLGPTAVAVKPGALDKVMAVLAELGYLGEVVAGE